MKLCMSQPTIVFFTLDLSPEVELLDHVVDLFLTFWDTSIHIVFHSIWTNILPHGYEDYLFTNTREEFSSVQSISCVRLFVIARTGACQASLSITNSHSLLKLMSTESVMPSNPLSSPSPAFNLSQHQGLFQSGGQSIGVSALASVFPVNVQDWFPLGWTGWVSLQSKGLSWVFSNTTVQKHQFLRAQLSL